jgi:hypothetical protein
VKLTPLAERSREELAALVPEYLLIGHLIDRAGMPHLISAFGREVMGEIAIAEWMGASPIYTKRTQRALDFEGDAVETIFKAMQIDIGAPPQFMDFRYVVHDHDRGEFWLDHCGALMDVEPMGHDYIVTMCHDIEDPTFDATALATNERAQVRPVHRPPRVPADRQPHCHWTVTIADEHEPAPYPDEAVRIGATEAAGLTLADPDPTDDGGHDYRGPVVADLDFAAWSRSTLVRVAEEVCLQGHLLALAFRDALARRADDEQTREIFRHQFTGAAGMGARRLRHLLPATDGLEAVAEILVLHPAFLPAAYTGVEVELTDRLLVRLPASSPALTDAAWPALLDAEHLAPLDAIVREVDARYRADAVDDGDGLTVEIVIDDEPAAESSDVALAAFSTGADFAFEPRPASVAIRPPRAVL